MLKVMMLVGLSFLLSCKPEPRYLSEPSLAKYAAEAKQRGSRQALLRYGSDEEEGDSVAERSFDYALDSYQWIVGEPIDEKALVYPDTDSLFTTYLIQVRQKFGTSRDVEDAGIFWMSALRALSPDQNQMVVLKSGGTTVVDGVLIKKRPSPCFSELLPRLYLLALRTDTSDKIGTIPMGCRGIYMVNGDQLRPRETRSRHVPDGMRDRYHNSLKEFAQRFSGR